MENKDLELKIISQLILECRTSLETISKLFGKNPTELYQDLMSLENETITRALGYVLNYETSDATLINQDESKRKARAFITKLYMAKTAQEKVKLINSLDNSAEIAKLKVKPIDEYSEEDYNKLINYRYKYAISKREIFMDFDITRVRLENREKILDEPLKQRLEALNEFHNYANYYGGLTSKKR